MSGHKEAVFYLNITRADCFTYSSGKSSYSFVTSQTQTSLYVFCWDSIVIVFPSVCPSVSVTDGAASAVFQTMLTVCHRKRPKLCKQLLKRTMEYLSSRSSAPGVRLEVFFFFCKGYCSRDITLDTILTPTVRCWSSWRTRPPVAS